jgi:hypothetical protein
MPEGQVNDLAQDSNTKILCTSNPCLSHTNRINKQQFTESHSGPLRNPLLIPDLCRNLSELEDVETKAAHRPSPDLSAFANRPGGGIPPFGLDGDTVFSRGRKQPRKLQESFGAAAAGRPLCGPESSKKPFIATNSDHVEEEIS